MYICKLFWQVNTTKDENKEILVLNVVPQCLTLKLLFKYNFSFMLYGGINLHSTVRLYFSLFKL